MDTHTDTQNHARLDAIRYRDKAMLDLMLGLSLAIYASRQFDLMQISDMFVQNENNIYIQIFNIRLFIYESSDK
jgi:hypothetical protein